ncbi:hypothetical protein SFK227_4599 [Shigella flexneri K-227]|uniref:Uncharacterized protein n=1 Tax=Shigella flexneri K-227 TaxID=766147 RepID=F5P259_SHIFL|nr:hypothetical protein SFK227_4599 [Shigella flexneri K-227]
MYLLCVMQVSIENNSFRGHLLYKIKIILSGNNRVHLY